MAVTSATPSITFTANGSTTDFAFNFVVPATDTTGTITDSTADMSLSSAVLTVDTAGLFYTSDLQGKAITVTGAGVSSADLTTTILSVDSATQITLNASASTAVNNTNISITTGTFNTTLKNNSDLLVFVDGTQKTITTDYTVRLNLGDDANKSGTVIFNSAPSNGAKVVIIRDVTLQRTTDFQTGGALTAKSLNAQFDNVIMAVQDTQFDTAASAIKFPSDETLSTTTLPAAATRGNKILGFNSSGEIAMRNDITNGDSASITVTDITASGTSTLATVDINAGAIDNTAIGLVSQAAGAFTTLTSTSTTNFAAGFTAAGLVYPTSDGTNEQVLSTDGSGNLTFRSIAGLSLFTALTDTPSTYVGQDNKYLKVDESGGAIVFDTLTSDDATQGSNNIYFSTSGATVNTTNLTEGTNLYYTDARADARIANNIIDEDDFATDSATRAPSQQSTKAYIQSQIETKDNTDEITEGSTNLYFTNARARAAVSVTDAGGDGSLAYDNSTGVITYTGPSASEVRAHFTGGTGISITSGDIALDFSEFSTTNVVEGTNLYYTTARGNADFDTRLATKTTDNLTEGSSNLYYTDARAQAVSINNVVEDTTPQLGGDLDTQAFALKGTDVLPSTGSYGGHFSGGEGVRLHNSTSDHLIRTQQASGRQNIAFITDIDGSYSAANSGSGLIYSPLNMQVRDRGESTKTRTTFDVGVPYQAGTGSTITQGSVTGKLLDVVAGDRKIYLQGVSGGSFSTGTATTGVVTGTVTAVNSIGTNAVELTYDTNFASTAATSDLANIGFARFSARDVLNTNGMRTSEPELHLEAGRIAFESNGTKMLDITDSGNIVADISTGQTLSPFGGILSDPSNMVEIKGGRYASGLRIYDASVGDGTKSGFQLDPFHFDKYLGSDQKKGGQFSIQLFGEGLPKESYGSFGEGDALGVHQKFEIKDNSDYYIGTVNTVSGDATVTDHGGSLFSNASAGDWIRIEGAVSDSNGNAMSGNLNCTITSVASDNSTIEINVPSSAGSGKVLSDIITGTGRNATIIKNSSTAIRMSAGTTGATHTFTHKSEQNGTNVDSNDRVNLAFEAKKIIFTAGTDSDNVNAIQAENSEVIINEGQNDVDFRIHSNSSDDVLKVDAGDDKLITNGGQGYDTNNNSYRPNGGVKVQKGLTVAGDNFLDILHTRRESTTAGNYSIEVANDYTSTAFSAGGTAGSFGMAAYSDNSGSLGYVYPAFIQGVIGDGGSLASGGAGPSNNGVQIRTFDTGGHGSQYQDTTSAAEFRATSTKLMNDKLNLSYDSGTNTVRLNTPSTAIHFNSDNADVDFRVDGDVNDNILFVNAGLERVGVKTDAPNYDLQVVGTFGATTLYGDGSNLNIDLGDLDDVDFSAGKVTGQYVRWNGTSFVSSDVEFTTATLGTDLNLNGNSIIGKTSSSLTQQNLDDAGVGMTAGTVASSHRGGGGVTANSFKFTLDDAVASDSTGANSSITLGLGVANADFDADHNNFTGNATGLSARPSSDRPTLNFETNKTNLSYGGAITTSTKDLILAPARVSFQLEDVRTIFENDDSVASTKIYAANRTNNVVSQGTQTYPNAWLQYESKEIVEFHSPDTGSGVEYFQLTLSGNVTVDTDDFIFQRNSGAKFYVYQGVTNSNTVLVYKVSGTISTGTTDYLAEVSTDRETITNLSGNIYVSAVGSSNGGYTSQGARATFKEPIVLGNKTTTQRDAITATNGMMLYNQTTHKMQVYANGSWVDLH